MEVAGRPNGIGLALASAAALALPGCLESPQQQERIEELQRELSDFRRRAASLERKLDDAAELELELRKKIDALETRNVELGEEIEKTEAELRALHREFDAYVERYRLSAIGRQVGSLATRDGKVYTDVKVAGMDDESISITHSVGSRRIPARLLPETWQEEFRFDP